MRAATRDRPTVETETKRAYASLLTITGDLLCGELRTVAIHPVIFLADRFNAGALTNQSDGVAFREQRDLNGHVWHRDPRRAFSFSPCALRAANTRLLMRKGALRLAGLFGSDPSADQKRVVAIKISTAKASD